MNIIHLTNGEKIEVKTKEMETKPTMVICVDNDERVGLVIPMTSIIYISDEGGH